MRYTNKTYLITKLNPTLIQESLHQMLCKLPPDEFTLFHMSTTYRPYQDRTYTERDLNKFFTNFYLKTLLPDIFQTRKWTMTKRLQQPIVLSFLDEHEMKPVVSGHDVRNQPIYAFPTRLHHHSIVASRPRTTEFLTSLIGTNTLLNYSAKFMTTDLKICDAERVFYASKMLWKYPEFQQFGFR